MWKLTKSLLRRYPKFHNFLIRLRRKLSGTKIDEKYWATKHLREGNDWVRSYWDSRGHGHRILLIERICRFSRSNILEIGCNCGPNLYLLSKKFPNAEIKGIDINSIVVQKRNEWFAQEYSARAFFPLHFASKPQSYFVFL